MSSISDQMLADGCARHIEALHGEQIEILSGPDAGKFFTVVKEIEQDLVLTTDITEDRRAKRIIRFIEGNVPRLDPQARVRTSDGKKWNAVQAPLDGYLSTDFELKEIDSRYDS